jgi:hypothetical protein
MAVTIIKPYKTTFGKRNYLEHHRNPSGTINKAKWLLSKSERDINKFNSLVCSIEAGVLSSFEEKSWLAAISMAEYCINSHIKNIEDEFNINKYKDYRPRKSVSSKNIPWYDCLLGGK